MSDKYAHYHKVAHKSFVTTHTARPVPPSRIESSLYRLFRLDPVLTNIIESKLEIVPGVEDKEVAL